MTKDKVVKEVIKDLTDRSLVGIRKYGTTLHQNNVDDFYNHLYEEVLDASNYLKKIMMDKKLKQSKVDMLIINKRENKCYDKNDVHLLLQELGYKTI